MSDHLLICETINLAVDMIIDVISIIRYVRVKNLDKGERIVNFNKMVSLTSARHILIRNVFLISISLLIILFMTGCQQKNDDFQLFIFTTLNEETKKQIQTIINDHSRGDQPIDVEFHNPMPEKLIVEFVDHSGDLILMEKELLSSIFDPVGLHALDEIKNTNDKNDLKEYKLKDEEGNIHLYALPIPLESSLLKDLNYNGSAEMVGIIPKYTNYQDEAYNILSELVNTNN